MAPLLRFEIEEVHPDIQRLPVSRVRITIHSLGPIVPDGQICQNHWTIELLLQKGSVRLDMSLLNPNCLTDCRGHLKVSLLEYQLSSGYINFFDFEVIDKRTVGHFTNNILDLERHHYNMCLAGVGCRHWIMVVIGDWQQAGFIETATTTSHSLSSYIYYNWSRMLAPIPLKILKGSFFTLKYVK